MTRKGFEKVRTGCITCKARKVKCDEEKPRCSRCIASHRVCGGYRTPPVVSFSWNDLLQVRPSTIPSSTSSSNQLRDLDFFRCIIAPALSGPLGNLFWAHHVCQLTIQEPATRYAVLAISSLYERFDPFSYDCSFSDKHRVAICYYNKAMRHVASSTHLSVDTTLIVSILFVCIEFLRGNTIAAIEHCRHGLRILGSMKQISPNISAIMRHLYIFPFFFAAALPGFPLIQAPMSVGYHIIDLLQATEALDCLMARVVKLLRTFDPFRLGIADTAEIPPSLFLTQHELDRELDTWRAGLSEFERNLDSNDQSQAHLRILKVRWHVCKAWLQMSSHQDEMFCDRFRDQFERIVDLAREEATSKMLVKTERAKVFSFEMGLSPLLHFVVLKCRFLKIRLEAWCLLRTVGCARESLWDSNEMYGIGKRIIEREHGVELSPSFVTRILEDTRIDYTLPSDDQRIRDSFVEEGTETYVDLDGSRVNRRKIFFFVCSDDQNELRRVQDWIYLPERS